MYLPFLMAFLALRVSVALPDLMVLVAAVATVLLLSVALAETVSLPLDAVTPL